MKTHGRRRKLITTGPKRRAWDPRVMPRIPRFRWKSRIKCRRRFVYAREPDETITMRRAICRLYRRGVALSRGKVV
ncbi:MAG TPA: hypothetical protein VH327_00215 [Gammaproteobacteria bacterium]|jgi:hypothetical protein|nr:hypothetical protein [Gammaproteobacteria bacterium]